MTERTVKLTRRGRILVKKIRDGLTLWINPGRKINQRDGFIWEKRREEFVALDPDDNVIATAESKSALRYHLETLGLF
jgi:hypothetical protein